MTGRPYASASYFQQHNNVFISSSQRVRREILSRFQRMYHIAEHRCDSVYLLSPDRVIPHITLLSDLTVHGIITNRIIHLWRKWLVLKDDGGDSV